MCEPEKKQWEDTQIYLKKCEEWARLNKTIWSYAKKNLPTWLQSADGDVVNGVAESYFADTCRPYLDNHWPFLRKITRTKAWKIRDKFEEIPTEHRVRTEARNGAASIVGETDAANEIAEEVVILFQKNFFIDTPIPLKFAFDLGQDKALDLIQNSEAETGNYRKKKPRVREYVGIYEVDSDGQEFSLVDYYVDPENMNPREQAEISEFERISQDVVKTRPYQERVVFLLYHEFEKTFAQISAILGGKENTYRQQMRRIREKIKVRLGIE